MKQLSILLTFDHELSLGGVRSYAQNLFEPTDHLLELADDLDVPLCFFTDVCCAIRFREWDRESFFEPYQRQIRDITGRGHDVQLHLHPHWMDSDYRDGTFVPSESYTLSVFADRAAPNDIPGIVNAGVGLLEELCRPVRPDYRCVAYRGGGFNLAPCTPLILRSLYDAGIRINSSIGKGMQFRSRTNVVDQRGMPAEANWFIAPEGPIDQPAPDGILEVPLATRPRNTLNNVPFLVKRVLRKSRAYRSTGWAIIGEQSTARDRLARLFPRSVWYVGFDSYARSVRDVMTVLRHHVRTHDDSERIVCAACSHPKTMGAYQREVMRGFVERTREHYGDVVRFVTFRQIHDEVFEGPAAARPEPVLGER